MESSSEFQLPLITSLSAEEFPCPSEESGWSLYIADFIAAQYYNKESTSLINLSDGSDAARRSSYPSINIGGLEKQLGFKRRKHARVHEDDDTLEDTASSPLNSPKVLDSDSLGRSTDAKKKLDNTTISKIAKVGYVRCGEMKIDETVDQMVSHSERKWNGCTELRKRGLCLVPLSMLIDYLQ